MFDDVSINVESIVPVIVSNEGMNQSILVNHDNWEGKQKQKSGERVSGNVYPLEKGENRVVVLSNGYGQVEETE